ncbi:EAL domain-containing protein [Granulicella tundricola]|nr:EAL domain-containing protein [Granulicella tundricola]
MSGPELIEPKCSACKDGVSQPFPMTMAFQPIVDVLESRVYAYEALVRGLNNEPAGVVMAQLTEDNRYAFDQSCRVAAITLAARLGLKDTGAKLSINFMPGAVYNPAACIRLTLETARKLDFPLDLLIFEITEMEEIKDRNHVLKIAQEYRRHGFQMAIDDFGSGYSGLNLLADLTPDILKLDMDLTRNLHARPTALAIVRSTAELCRELGVTCIAEGVETVEELRALRSCGIRLMQGYLLARPAFEALPAVAYPQDLGALPGRREAAQSLSA